MRSAKYGAKIRKLVDASIKAKNSRYECPKCGKVKVARKAFSVWVCRSCSNTFAGGAYSFFTETGAIARRLIQAYAKL